MSQIRVESAAIRDFARVMQDHVPPLPRSGAGTAPLGLPSPRLNLDPDKVKNGLGRLVLTLRRICGKEPAWPKESTL